MLVVVVVVVQWEIVVCFLEFLDLGVLYVKSGRMGGRAGG